MTDSWLSSAYANGLQGNWTTVRGRRAPCGSATQTPERYASRSATLTLKHRDGRPCEASLDGVTGCAPSPAALERPARWRKSKTTETPVISQAVGYRAAVAMGAAGGAGHTNGKGLGVPKVAGAANDGPAPGAAVASSRPDRVGLSLRKREQ